MTPIGMRYEDAYARAHPFDKLVQDMLQPEMVREAAGLMHQVLSHTASAGDFSRVIVSSFFDIIISVIKV